MQAKYTAAQHDHTRYGRELLLPAGERGGGGALPFRLAII